MLFTNETPLPAAMVRDAGELDMMTALFLCAATFRLGDAAADMALAPAQRPLLLAPRADVPNDASFLKLGAGVCASGSVFPERPGAGRGTARLTVGTATRAVAAFGPRVWREGAMGRLEATAPLPFERVAMTWENAYGGSVWEPTSVLEVDGEEAIVPEHPNAYALNTHGIGFYPRREHALEQPLPALEDPDRLVRSWDDRPEPVCFAPYPLSGGMRVRSIFDEKDRKVDLSLVGRLFVRSGPRTTFDEIPVGTTITLEGMRPRGERLTLVVPPAPVAFEVRVGEVETTLVPSIDAVDLDAEAAEARLLWRVVYRYPLVQLETREARCVPSAHFPEPPKEA